MFMKKAGFIVAVAGMLALAVGCSSSSDSTDPKPDPKPPTKVEGKVVQGYVSGADVWADEITDPAKGSGNFILDDKEKPTKTTSDANGDFKLGATPAYDYVLASVGGTDKLTGKPAIPMIAPKGAKNITPLTTLVAMTPVADRKDLIAALGGQENFDVDIAAPAGVSAEVLKIAKTVETALKAISAGASQANTAQLLNIAGSIAADLRTEIKASGVAGIADLKKITGSATLEAVAGKSVDAAVKAGMITAGQKEAIVSEVQAEVKKTVEVIAKNTDATGKVKEEAVVKETAKSSLKAKTVALTLANSTDRVTVDVNTWNAALTANQANNVKDAVVTLGFVDPATPVTRNNAVLTITATRAAQKLDVIISNVTIVVKNANGTPDVTLGMDNARLTIKGTRSNGTEVSAAFNSAKDVQEVLEVAGDKITVKLAAIEDKMRKKDEFKDIKGFVFSAGSYAIKFALSVLNVFDDVNVKLTVN